MGLRGVECGVMKGKKDEQTACEMLRAWEVNLIVKGKGSMKCFVYE